MTRILDSLVLAASLDTAARCARVYRDRRSGVDPSSQETEHVASRSLDGAAEDLREIATRLRLYHLLAPADDLSESGIMRRFEAMMLVRKAGGVLRVAHQSLLSLYPAVDESLVESARRMHNRFLEVGEEGISDLEDLDRLEEFSRAISL